MSPLRTAHGWEEAKKALLPKTCHIYLALMKLGTVIPYLKKIKKIYIYISQRHLLSFVDMSFFYQKSTIFVISRNTSKKCILEHSF